MVKNGNFTLLLTSSGSRIAISALLLTSSDQEWQFHIPTDIYWSRMNNFTLLLKSHGHHEWQFDIATDI